MFAFAAFLLLFAEESGQSHRASLEELHPRVCDGGRERSRPDQPGARRSTKARSRACSKRLDPFSVFFDPGQFEQLNELEKSTRKGFRQRRLDPARPSHRVADACPAPRPRSRG